MKAKYVMTDNGPIIFPATFNHSDFSHFKPKSGGTVVFGVDKEFNIIPVCVGSSMTLNLNSHPDDSDMLKIYLSH